MERNNFEGRGFPESSWLSPSPNHSNLNNQQQNSPHWNQQPSHNNTFPTSNETLPVLPLLTLQPTTQPHEYLNAVYPPHPVLQNLEEKYVEPEDLKVWGKSISGFAKLLEKYCQHNFPNSDWPPSSVAGKLADVLYSANDKLLYVLITDVWVINSKPELWTGWAENCDNNGLAYEKIITEGESFAWKYLPKIGNAEFTIFLFSPMDISFTIRKDTSTMGSVFYHGKLTESLQMGTVYFGHPYPYPRHMMKITVTFSCKN